MNVNTPDKRKNPLSRLLGAGSQITVKERMVRDAAAPTERNEYRGVWLTQEVRSIADSGTKYVTTSIFAE